MKALMVVLVAGAVTFSVASIPAAALDLIGEDAFGGWTEDAPGVRRLIRPSDLPPTSSDSIADAPTVVPRPAGARLSVPEGFKVKLFADGLGRASFALHQTATSLSPKASPAKSGCFAPIQPTAG